MNVADPPRLQRWAAWRYTNKTVFVCMKLPPNYYIYLTVHYKTSLHAAAVLQIIKESQNAEQHAKLMSVKGDFPTL